MSLNKKKLLSGSFIIIALFSLFNYLFAHLAYLNMNTDTGIAYEYITLYLSKIASFLIPVAVCALSLAVHLKDGFKSASAFTLALSSARVFYYLPYYYIIFIFNYGYDSVESIALSLLASLGVVLFTSLFTLVTIAISQSIIKKQHKSEKDFSASSYLNTALTERQNPLDLTTGTNLVFLIASLISLVSAIIPEIIDTVSFFIEYGLDYTAGEILTIMANYLLLFALTIGAYFLAACIKNRFLTISYNNE